MTKNTNQKKNIKNWFLANVVKMHKESYFSLRCNKFSSDKLRSKIEKFWTLKAPCMPLKPKYVRVSVCFPKDLLKFCWTKANWNKTLNHLIYSLINIHFSISIFYSIISLGKQIKRSDRLTILSKLSIRFSAWRHSIFRTDPAVYKRFKPFC